MWELYTEGNPLERGLANGILTQELTYNQEKIFTDKIKEFIPSPFYQKILKKFVLFFNRELYKNVPEEYLIELYGMSKYASEDFNFIAKPYWRMLYFHAAHDIGHSLQDLALVGCTSFAAWGDKTADGKLLIGRNFDFYVNDSFNKNKVIAFVSPDRGYKYAMVTWPGMIGAVSGMNMKGLTVTINAGKSGIPFKAKTPISFVTKEILQYAKNIEEAIQIAKNREVFVAESILVGSSEDNRAVTIEVSPNKFGVYETDNTDFLICANHFQSNEYKEDKRNRKQIAESHSMYRFNKMKELLTSAPLLTPSAGAEILRNKQGLNELPLGMGNEKAINQLLSHHGILFQPDKKILWVSANPYQLGEFVAYDLNKVFSTFPLQKEISNLSETDLNIAEDPFLYSLPYSQYEEYRIQSRHLITKFNKNRTVSNEYLNSYLSLNPEYWESYFNVAEYYFRHKNFSKALFYYNLALTKEISTIPAQTKIKDRILKCEKKLH
ncbi:C45 family peptidase [Apibacter sp. HY039]|uniref:C45 family autoproteolytic acyltransferase/hydolase n=1 Tax=Apibacter sp. HY039 TaxID=2501476 RepID=UPI002107882F|nr:C45 family peptidase [Apibacter sp. HY039]